MTVHPKSHQRLIDSLLQVSEPHLNYEQQAPVCNARVSMLNSEGDETTESTSDGSKSLKVRQAQSKFMSCIEVG